MLPSATCRSMTRWARLRVMSFMVLPFWLGCAALRGAAW